MRKGLLYPGTASTAHPAALSWWTALEGTASMMSTVPLMAADRRAESSLRTCQRILAAVAGTDPLYWSLGTAVTSVGEMLSYL